MKTPDNAIIGVAFLELTKIDPNFYALAIFIHWRKLDKLKAQKVFAPEPSYRIFLGVTFYETSCTVYRH
jgi:hypothetical protein